MKYLKEFKFKTPLKIDLKEPGLEVKILELSEYVKYLANEMDKLISKVNKISK